MIKGLVSLNELIHSTQCKNIYIYIYAFGFSALFLYSYEHRLLFYQVILFSLNIQEKKVKFVLMFLFKENF